MYLTAQPDCQGGTVVLEHRATGMRSNPRTAGEVIAWKRDTNETSAWRPLDLAAMRFNRGVVYPTDIFHAALPRAGFGSGPADGRLVFTMFFD